VTRVVGAIDPDGQTFEVAVEIEKPDGSVTMMELPVPALYGGGCYIPFEWGTGSDRLAQYSLAHAMIFAATGDEELACDARVGFANGVIERMPTDTGWRLRFTQIVAAADQYAAERRDSK